MFFPEPSCATSRHLYPGFWSVYTKEVSLYKVTWLCAFPFYVFIFSTLLSSCPTVNTFIDDLLCARHSADSGARAVKQTYWIPLLKNLHLNGQSKDLPQDIFLNWLWAMAVKVHIIALIMGEEVTTESCPQHKQALWFIQKRHEGGEAGSAWLGDLRRFQGWKKCDSVFFLWYKILSVML